MACPYLQAKPTRHGKIHHFRCLAQMKLRPMPDEHAYLSEKDVEEYHCLTGEYVKCPIYKRRG